MPVIGFHLTKISVERKDRITGQVNVKTNLKISDVKEEERIAEVAKDMTSLRFDFEFKIDYEPKAANLLFVGHVLDVEKDEDAKKILKNWKNKKIDDELRLRISNHVWLRCNIKALLLEEEIGLPIHLPLPRLVGKE